MTRTAQPPEGELLVPLFPIPEHVLLPAAPTPYRIFEPHFRQMVVDLLDKPADERWLAVPRLLAAEHPPGHADAEPFHPVASLGLMTLATPLSDGDYLIVVEGRHPCHVEEVPAPFTEYRVGRATPLDDCPGGVEDPAVHTDALIQGVFSLFGALGPAAADLPMTCGKVLEPEDVVYRIAAGVVHDVDLRQQVLDLRCALARRTLVLDELVDLLAAAAFPVGPTERHADGLI